MDKYLNIEREQIIMKIYLSQTDIRNFYEMWMEKSKDYV